ncbi:polysaccharide biosynthesis C-terminal domain-containing protein [Faecalicatena contorta]|uniref:lipopolysaccharide biosynthesis protein n=1 Tax=Faecalicatena contorta TaxID=39482 RepID=UPI001F3A767B|nr:polysaccharide biosynthesis C-terminal domain-containing protein [Faecalicatena contorta]MCF2680736.1 polysaccharide biosynthesis C-terminal domain-containing protein [Faecalicatena contorta]
MRSKQAAKNMLANVILQVLVFISGIVLPRFFLEEYGSSINGMVTSINQFLVYLGLAEAGVGTASVVALYAPLANDDHEEINGILSATRRFYYRSGYIFIVLVAVCVAVYPYLIMQQLDEGLVRMMFVVLASSTLVDYLLLGKYKVLLTANQKGYVVAYVQALGTAANMMISIGMILLHFNVLIVKATATIIYILRFFIVRFYVKKEYKYIDFYAVPKSDKLTQRSAALLHQIVGVIVNNTDVILLTVCLGTKSLIEVSVYGIYNMIVYAINTMLTSFSNGLTAGFGEVVSKGEKKILNDSFSNYEYLYMIILFCVFICMGVLILPFVSIYTMNVSDANYIRPVSALLFTTIILLQNIRIPGLTIICAAGHFKETKRQAILEAVINVGVSLTLVWKFGMNGVLFGTVCSYGYRSVEVILYNRKYLVQGTGMNSIKRISRNLVVSLVLVFGWLKFVPQSMGSFVEWFLYAVIVAGLSGICLVCVNYVCEPKEFQKIVNRIKSLKK